MKITSKQIASWRSANSASKNWRNCRSLEIDSSLQMLKQVLKVWWWNKIRSKWKKRKWCKLPKIQLCSLA